MKEELEEVTLKFADQLESQDDASDTDSGRSDGCESIFSDIESVTSVSSLSSIGLYSFSTETDLTEALTDCLWDDEILRRLFQTAVEVKRIGRDRFQRNLCKLIKQFAVDLLQEVIGKEHKDIARFVRLRSTGKAVSNSICSRTETLTKNENTIDVDGLAQDSKPGIDHVSKQELGVEESDDEDPDGGEIEDVDKLEYDLAKARQFIETSFAFTALQKNLQDFVNPTFASRLGDIIKRLARMSPHIKDFSHLQRVASELRHTNPHNIQIQRAEIIHWNDEVRAKIEDWTRQEWEWWPLERPRRRLGNGTAKVEWLCVREFQRR
jgi:hypothetical protein